MRAIYLPTRTVTAGRELGFRVDGTSSGGGRKSEIGICFATIKEEQSRREMVILRSSRGEGCCYIVGGCGGLGGCLRSRALPNVTGHLFREPHLPRCDQRKKCLFRVESPELGIAVRGAPAAISRYAVIGKKLMIHGKVHIVGDMLIIIIETQKILYSELLRYAYK